MTEKDAIVAILKVGDSVSCYNEVLACYPTSDDFYFVEYLYSQDTIDKLNLSEHYRKLVLEDEELQEVFDTPEEAADFYLQIRGDNWRTLPSVSDKRKLKDKLKQSEKDAFFDE